MKITEIYSSVQGETQYAGLPCTLVRTTGCDLRCGYCDTAYAFQGGRDMTVAEIAAEVARLGPPLVLLTGGEPMLQRELPALAERLLADGRRVMIETSGAHRLDRLPVGVIRIVDCAPSTPPNSWLRMKRTIAGPPTWSQSMSWGEKRKCCFRRYMAVSTLGTWLPGCCATGSRHG
jgi:hypothetical protein